MEYGFENAWQRTVETACIRLFLSRNELKDHLCMKYNNENNRHNKQCNSHRTNYNSTGYSKTLESKNEIVRNYVMLILVHKYCMVLTCTHSHGAKWGNSNFLDTKRHGKHQLRYQHRIGHQLCNGKSYKSDFLMGLGNTWDLSFPTFSNTLITNSPIAVNIIMTASRKVFYLFRTTFGIFQLTKLVFEIFDIIFSAFYKENS